MFTLSGTASSSSSEPAGWSHYGTVGHK